MSGASSPFDDGLAKVFVAQAFARVAAGVARGGEARQDVLVEEVGEGAVAHVVQEAGDTKGFDHQAGGGHGLAVCRQDIPQRRVERAAPQARLVHHPKAMREAAVFRGGEDPAGALQLADAAEALHPRRIEQVFLGDRLGRQAGLRTLGRA